MSFLLDTDICSAHLKRPAGLMHRFIQHSGRLFLSTVALGELYVWAHRRSNPNPLLADIEKNLLQEVKVLDYDTRCAEEFGRIRGQLIRRGITVSRVDMMIAAVALNHDLTLATHNLKDFREVPGLRLADWISS